VALKVEPRVKPTGRAGACIISGSDAIRFDTQTPTKSHTRLGRQRVDQSQGIHVIRHIVGQAMAVPPNATIDAPTPPSSNAVNKTPTSSRMYISRISSSFSFVFFLLQPSSHWAARQQNPATRVPLTYLYQIVYRPFPPLMPSAIFQTITSRQAMHIQTSRNSTMPSEAALSVAE
jgi:hypothetical protein